MGKGSKKPGMAEDAAIALEIGTSIKAPAPNTARCARSRSMAGISKRRGQVRKLLESPLAANASRMNDSSGCSEKNPVGMSFALRARMSGHSILNLVMALRPTAQASWKRFLAALENAPL